MILNRIFNPLNESRSTFVARQTLKGIMYPTPPPTAAMQPKRPKPYTISYVSLLDCAPLLAAERLGFFKEAGVEVRLSRELGWATVRDKLVAGYCDAAHAPSGMVAALTLGVDCAPTSCEALLALSYGGNAITLSTVLWKDGVRDVAGLKKVASARKRAPVIGVVYQMSTHRILLHRWLEGGGMDPFKDVEIVVVPPAQVHEHLKAGYIDGFCAGEPWNSVAVAAGTGWIAATSAALAPRHLEKVVVARSESLELDSERHAKVQQALLHACQWCAVPDYINALSALLRPEFDPAVAGALRESLTNRARLGNRRHSQGKLAPDFASESEPFPTLDEAQWLTQNLELALNRPVFSAFSPQQLKRSFTSSKSNIPLPV